MKWILLFPVMFTIELILTAAFLAIGIFRPRFIVAMSDWFEQYTPNRDQYWGLGK